MKWGIALWMVISGCGLSFSIMKERRAEICLIKEMEQSLRQMAYYMHKWRLPMEEVFGHAAEEAGVLSAFFLVMQERLQTKTLEPIDELWQRNSLEIPGMVKLGENIKKSWLHCFALLPMDVEAVGRRLTERAEEIKGYREALETKYQGEQKLILTLGLFTGCFLCLVLW